jgi:hypothetical protein
MNTNMLSRADTWLSYISLLLGFLFMRLVLFQWSGWGVSLYVVLYIGVVLWYFRQYRVKTTAEGYFWLAVLLATGAGFAIWQTNNVLLFLGRAVLLFGSAIYWVITAAGATLRGGTSDYLPFDIQHGFINSPFRNMSRQFQGLSALLSGNKEAVARIWQIAGGIFIGLLLIAFTGPFLLRADAGGFTSLMLAAGRLLPRIDTELVMHLLLTVPAAAYIFGLLYGCVPNRHSYGHDAGRIEQSFRGWSKLPQVTAIVALFLLSAVYAVFILSQLPYHFSAFRGVLPPGWVSVAEYARQGFFELCFIAAFNLGLLAVMNVVCVRDKGFKLLNSVLSLVTLTFVVIAFSKMALYVAMFGLTISRLLASVSLPALAVVCVAVIIRQKKAFSTVRLAVFMLAILVSTLVLIEPDRLVAEYNAGRYLAGTLEHFDATVLYGASLSGTDVAKRLLDRPIPEELRAQLYQYLGFMLQLASQHEGKMWDTWEAARVRRLLGGTYWFGLVTE